MRAYTQPGEHRNRNEIVPLIGELKVPEVDVFFFEIEGPVTGCFRPNLLSLVFDRARTTAERMGRVVSRTREVNSPIVDGSLTCL